MSTRTTWILLGLTAAIFVGMTYVETLSLPERVATHFDGAGRPNGWMTRQGHLLATILTGLGIPALVVGICHLIGFLPASTLNVPNAAFWRAPENRQKATTILVRWSHWFGMTSMLWMIAVNHELVKANHIAPPRLSTAAVMLWSALYLAALLGLVVMLILQFTRVPDQRKGEAEVPI